MAVATTPVRALVRAALDAIPEGRELSEELWRRRHRGIRILLALHALGLAVFALARGYEPVHSLAECAVVAVCAWGAGRARGRKTGAAIATFGLVSSSALLVHFSGGTVEAHFHFFAVLAVITLYQDWTPFLLALGYVIVHHGGIGVLHPEAVYNHEAAQRNPWTWALVHAVFVLFAAVANLVAWRLNERARSELELILSSTGDGIYGIDPEGRITFANETAARLLGWPAPELVGRAAPDLTVGDAGDECRVHAPLDVDAIRAGECTFRRRGGSTFPARYVAKPIVDRGRVVGSVISFEDVTERNLADAELKRTLGLLAGTLESTADGILVVDAAGKITNFNRRFVDMWAIPHDLIAAGDDQRALSFVLEQLEDPEAFLVKVRQLYDDPDAESFDELRFKDGRRFERYSLPQRMGGRSVGRVWSFRDVTERHRLDEMKDAFLSAVSHELRTPLTSVLGYALTLERAGDRLSPEERADLLIRISTNARRLQRLLADTIDLDRLSRGIVSPNRLPTRLGELIERVTTESEALQGSSIVLEPSDAVHLLDAAKVERIVENLLTNAVRHAGPSARVRVRVESAAEAVTLTVEDNGSGVPDELKVTVFEPFHQGASATPHPPGIGIGLALVARFAALHGGKAWVEDAADGGAAFKVLLPAERIAPAGSAPAA